MKCPRYIGQTKRKLHIRLSGHIQETRITYKNNKPLTHKENWIKKLDNLGIVDQLVCILLEECEEELADDREQYWIGYFKSHVSLTNSNEGGQLNKSHSEETKQKISKANSGPKNGMFGKKYTMSFETKNKIGESLKKSEKFKNYYNNPEFSERMSRIQSEPLIVLNENLQILGEFKNCEQVSYFIGCSISSVKKMRSI